MREIAKRGMVFISWLVVLPLWLLFYAAGVFGNNAELFQGITHLLSLVPGKTGSYLRAGFMRLATGSGDDNLYIGFQTVFSSKGVRFGRDVYIGAKCMIGWAKVGDSVMIGSGVHVLSGRRQHPVGKDVKKDAPGELNCTRIGANVWIGNASVVMADVGENSVVGAGSVVVKAVPANVVAVGNPARVMRRVDDAQAQSQIGD